MTARSRLLRRYFLAALLLFVTGTLILTSYTLWLLRSDAILNGLEVSAMHSRSFEDFITQNLLVTDLVGANLLDQEDHLADVDHVTGFLSSTLRHAPFLRSLSLLNDRGRIIASSNPDNLGMIVPLESFLPTAARGPNMLRIGLPWSGRDFADGRPGEGTDNLTSFIPVVHPLKSEKQNLTVLFALNPDYFINHMLQTIEVTEGTVEVVRYDGRLLMSTDQEEPQGTLREYITRELRLDEVETGEFEQTLGGDRHVLTAFRASRLYPIVIITHLNRDYALRYWHEEGNTLLAIVIPSIMAVVLLAAVFYRRQQQLYVQRIENQRLQRINATVFDASNEATLVTDLDTKIVSINPAFTRATGYRLDEVAGRPLAEFLIDDKIAPCSPTISTSTESNLESPGVEVQQRCKDGSLIWVEILSTPERDEQGKIIGYHRISRNITERKLMEDRVRQLAFHDHLTNLPNRRLLLDHMGLAIASNTRSGSHSAILFLDLDNFKLLNDNYGHAVGDLMLIEMAHRLKKSVREMDTVARFGGDEFVILVNELNVDNSKAMTQIKQIAEKIRLAIAEPCFLTITHDGKKQSTIEHQCTSSIGVTLFVNQGTQEQILKQADDAMYRAKRAGNSLVIFH